MNILFLGGDKRYKYMMDELKYSHKVYQIGFNDTSENIFHLNLDEIDFRNFDVVLYPISGINDNLEIKSEMGLIKMPEDIFKTINSHTKFFTGLKTNKLLELIKGYNLISFLDFEDVENANNQLTVERCFR